MASDKTERFLRILFSLFIFLFFRLSSWICSVPAWLTLILHFTIGLPIFWFWLTLAAWLIAGVIWWALIDFGRWGVRETANEPPKENKNPYSYKNNKTGND